MNFQKLPLIIGFNLIIVVADIILLSQWAISFTLPVRLLIILVSILVFIGGNYLLLSLAFKKPVLKDKGTLKHNDLESALKGWKGMNTPFNQQIDIALTQLEQLESRKSKLRALSKDNTFDSAVDEVEYNMFANFNRLINRLLIYDKTDPADLNRSLAYINSILSTNARYLDVFRRFIDEIAMIGDTSDMDSCTLSLQTITDSLRELRTNGDPDNLR